MTPLQHQITELWGQISAATHRFLQLVAEFDEQHGWNGQGIVNCAHWLNVYCGIGMVAAREKVRIAHALRELPQINAAFGEGRITYSKVRAMARVATPENESVLLNIAIHGTAAHVERTARLYRKVERIEDAQKAADAYRDRYLQFRYDDDGHETVHGRLPTEVAELVQMAIERAMDLLEASGENTAGESAHDPVYDSAESFGARRADALKLIAEQFLATEASTAGSSSDRFQVVVHVDHAELANETGLGRETESRQGRGQGEAIRKCCEIEDGPTLAAETARRLGCDGSIVGIVDGESGEPLSIGRKSRAIPPAIRRALKARDGGCRFPGCPHTRYTEGHHIEHWANGGETKLGNLITLCHHHHRLVHEGGYRITHTDDGAFRFLQPDGEAVCDDFAVTGRFRGIALAETNRKRGVDIDHDTVITRWRGESMDASIVIDGLLYARERTRSMGSMRVDQSSE